VQILYLKELLNMRRLGENINDVHLQLKLLQEENEQIREHNWSKQQV